MSVLLRREVIEEIFFEDKIVIICLYGGWFSDALKVAKEVPLNKKGVKFHRSIVCSCYRSISIVLAIASDFVTVMKIQLLECFEVINLFCSAHICHSFGEDLRC